MFKKLQQRKGVSMIEYALLAGLIALFLVGAITFLRGRIDTTFRSVGNALP